MSKTGMAVPALTVATRSGDPSDACLVPSGVASPLGSSSHLLGIPLPAVALARLYGYDVLLRTIDNRRWRFRWCFIERSLTGVELRVRVGPCEATILLEDLGPFGSASDVLRPELPDTLHTAFLAGLGASLWRELEMLTERPIELVAVQPGSTIDPATGSVGFEVGDDSRGVFTRGILRTSHPELHDCLLHTSQREMGKPALPVNLPIRWSAVIGSTQLAAGEVRALEEHDIVVIGNSAHAGDGLTCWLGAGAQRRYLGRVTLRRDGRLQLIEFTTKGQTIMTSSDADAASTDEVGFDDIPVILRFELARWEAPLAEIANLRAGSVIELGQRIDQQSVTVWVEQRCIGKGQLVAIGERLGVRLLSVLAHTT